MARAGRALCRAPRDNITRAPYRARGCQTAAHHPSGYFCVSAPVAKNLHGHQKNDFLKNLSKICYVFTKWKGHFKHFFSRFENDKHEYWIVLGYFLHIHLGYSQSRIYGLYPRFSAVRLSMSMDFVTKCFAFCEFSWFSSPETSTLFDDLGGRVAFRSHIFQSFNFWTI